ncbi:PH domain-containing protein [Halorutilales archaeon Cl-col2-1]
METESQNQTGFDWLSLDDDEEVIWSGEPRIKSIAPAVVLGVILIPLVGLGLVVIAGAYLHVKNTDYVVTTDGLYKKTGTLSREVQKIGFDKVQNISFSQGALGNYFGYGNVEISTAGGSGVEMRFKSIAEPKEVQELINKEISRRTQESEDSDTGDEMTRQILEEIRRTRKAVESIDEKL